MSMTPAEALQRLREGNTRFVGGGERREPLVGQARGSTNVDSQQPFAVILGCSDSRVPVEMIFDQGPGELFVIRVAGNVVAPSQIGSVEFAAAQFGSRLVVVMGHSQCGAVQATLEQLRQPQPQQSPNLASIVDRIRPAVAGLVAERAEDRLLQRAIRANVRAAANNLRHGSDILEELIRDDGLLVVGAEYALETGVVEFFDGVPE